mgnify:CR=1 FL=1
MSSRALADLLTDFGSRAAAPEPMMSFVDTEPAVMFQPEPEIDVAGMVAEEVAKAEAALTERLSAIYEATLEAERANHAAEREALTRQIGGEAAALIESRFAEMQEQLVALTTAATARILAGVLSDEMQRRSIAALADRIRDAVRERDAVRVRALGPQSLCEALSAALGETARNVEFGERASFDLTVTIDSGIYETRLAEWSAELGGVIA